MGGVSFSDTLNFLSNKYGVEISEEQKERLHVMRNEYLDNAQDLKLFDGVCENLHLLKKSIL